jgi:hypothetical protein
MQELHALPGLTNIVVAGLPLPGQSFSIKSEKLS